MKKLILSVMAISAVFAAAFAIGAFSGPSGGHLLDSAPVGIWQATPSSPPQRKVPADRRLTPSDMADFYLCTDTLASGAWRTRSVKFEVNGEAVTICQIYGYDTQCKATLSGNTLSIPVQEVYRIMVSNTVSAAASVCPVNFNNNTFDPSRPIQGTIASDGAITLEPWALIVLEEGPYYGMVAAAMRSTLYRPCNATLSAIDFRTKEPTSWGVIISQPYTNRLAMENFANSGETVNLSLNPDGSAEMPSQYVGTNSLGKVFTWSIDASKANPTALPQPVKGSVAGNIISLEAWGAFPFNNPAKPVDRYTDTRITTSFTLSLPPTQSNTLNGDGSQQNPYQISSYADLLALSRMVNSGNDQSGIYFRQTTDINCANTELCFDPIGHTTSNLDYYQFDPKPIPFNGHYDGAGHKIINLYCHMGLRWYMGLFGVIGAQGSVTDLTLGNADMECYGRITGMFCGLNLGMIERCSVEGGSLWNSLFTTGGIAGMNFGTIRNCRVTADITSQGDIGGIAGYNAGVISGCEAGASLTLDAVFSTASPYIGGVAGVMKSDSKKVSAEGGPTVTDSYAYGKIIDLGGTGVAGGIIGGMVGTSKVRIALQRCFSMSSIHTEASGSNGACGGVAGNLAYGNINDCLFAGTINTPKGASTIGGILAKTGAGMSAGCISECYSSARIKTIDPNPAPAIAVFPKLGTGACDTYFVNVYYDTQTSGLTYSTDTYTGARTTRQLTDGTLPSGFDSTKWITHANTYPMLRSLESSSAGQVAATPVLFADGESAGKVKSPFSLAPAASGVEWAIEMPDGLSMQTSALTLQGNTALPANSYASENVVIYSDEPSCSKVYQINIVPSSLFEGKGTAAEPYLIKTLADLKTLADATVNHASTFAGDHFRLDADIDCAYDPAFHGIASSGSPMHVFAGTFDGNGHTISRMVINAVATDASGIAQPDRSPSYVGFFGRVSATGTIRNLTLAADCRLFYTATSGALVGYLDGTVENCVNLADVTGINGNIGGIAGAISKTGHVKDCYNGGTIRCGATIAGGIAGNCAGTITGCQNDGMVAGTATNALRPGGTQKNMGGIAGQTVSTASLENCLNTAPVYSYGGSGGLVGYLNGSAIIACVNTGVAVCTGSDVAPSGGIYGNSATAKPTISAVYYDRNVNNRGANNGIDPQGVASLTTATLASACLPTGLDSEKWQFSDGAYPVLRSFVNLPSAQAYSHMVALFAPDQLRTDLRGTLALARREGMTWSLKVSDPAFTLTADALTATPPANDTPACDTLVSVAGQWRRHLPIRTLPKVFAGDGSKLNPYLITSVSDLTNLARMTNVYAASYAGSHFLINNDIDCESLTGFVPVGYGDNNFSGELDGGGHTLLNLNISGNTEASALIGTLGAGGAIRNLTLKGGSVTTAGAMRPVGAFAAYCSGSIENCVNYNDISTLTAGTNAGGIACQLNTGGRIVSCSNYGGIITRNSYLGGIVALQQTGSEITGCHNYGVLTPGGVQSGGIAGTSYGTIARCINHRAQVVQKGTFGGIVGYACDTTTLSYCVNMADITLESGSSTGGGLAGYAYGRMHMDSCVNHGNVTVPGGYAGGLVGRMGAKGSSVKRCDNYGDVVSEKQYAGGLAGYVDGTSSAPGSFTALTNYGAVTATGNYAGGAFGYIKANNNVNWCFTYGAVKGIKGNYVAGFAGYGYANFTDCLNVGNVEGNGYGIAGFVGDASGCSVIRCVNTGDVTGTSLSATATNFGTAGFWAKGKARAIDCCNLGSVTAPDYVSGFAGNWSSGSEASSCFSTAIVTATDEAPALAAAFIASTPAQSVFNSCCYIAVQPAGTLPVNPDAATPLAPTEIMDFNLGDAWTLRRATYPMLKALANNPAYAIASIGLLPTVSSDMQSAITANFYMGRPLDNLVWTCSPTFCFSRSNPGLVYAADKGDGWIKVTSADERFSRTFNLTVTHATGVNGTMTDVLATECYTLSGIRVANPVDGQLYIVRTLYSNGTATTRKCIWRGNR